ncbi:hypothetical protein AHAS_Ahas18G0172800 [Arachis hypogaea]
MSPPPPLGPSSSSRAVEKRPEATDVADEEEGTREREPPGRTIAVAVRSCCRRQSTWAVAVELVPLTAALPSRRCTLRRHRW